LNWFTAHALCRAPLNAAMHGAARH